MLISFPLFWSVHKYITDFMFSKSLLVDTGGNLYIQFKFFFFFGRASWLVGAQLPDQGLNPGPSS